MAKTTTVPSTQRYIDIAQIRGGIVITKTGLLRRVVKVEPLNFALKSEQDQNVIIGQYQNFLNALNFPIQIVIHSRRLDVAPYLHSLQEKIADTPNELLRFHALEYVEFVKGLTELTNIMDKKFFVVVGFEPQTLNKTSLLGNLFGKKEQSKIKFTAAEWKKYTDELSQRVEMIANGLTAIGLKAEVLDTQETIELYYNVFNPEEGSTEKLVEAESLQASIVSTKPDIGEKIDLNKLNQTVSNSANALNEGPSDSDSNGSSVIIEEEPGKESPEKPLAAETAPPPTPPATPGSQPEATTPPQQPNAEQQ